MLKIKESITAVIVDDEYWARENIRDLLADFPRVKIVGEAASVSKAREQINTLRPDAVFLDIQLAQGTGFDVLKGIEFMPVVVFVTAYDNFALRAFEVNALDYLLKPIDPQRLAESVQRLLAGTARRPEEKKSGFCGALNSTDQLLLYLENTLTMVSVGSILWISASRNNTHVVCADYPWPLKSRSSLKLWEDRLGSLAFLRIDRSTLVNTSRIKNLSIESAKPLLTFNNSDNFLLLGHTAAAALKKYLLNSYSLS